MANGSSFEAVEAEGPAAVMTCASLRGESVSRGHKMDVMSAIADFTLSNEAHRVVRVSQSRNNTCRTPHVHDVTSARLLIR
jgi:hypothetical protein